MTGGLKMGVNVAARTRHIFLGSAPQVVNITDYSFEHCNNNKICTMLLDILELYFKFLDNTIKKDGKIAQTRLKLMTQGADVICLKSYCIWCFLV